MFDWKWEFAWEILPRLITATGNTLLAAGAGYALALVLGLFLAITQRTPYRILTFAVREFVEFIRSTPLLLQIFFIFYVGPQFGIRLSPWMSGMIAIGLHYSCYLSEVYRGGIDNVPKGQWEAAIALNMTTLQKYRRVIIPQAIPSALSGMGNYPCRYLQRYPRCFRSLGLPNSFTRPMPSVQNTIAFLNPSRWLASSSLQSLFPPLVSSG